MVEFLGQNRELLMVTLAFISSGVAIAAWCFALYLLAGLGGDDLAMSLVRFALIIFACVPAMSLAAGAVYFFLIGQGVIAQFAALAVILTVFSMTAVSFIWRYFHRAPALIAS